MRSPMSAGHVIRRRWSAFLSIAVLTLAVSAAGPTSAANGHLGSIGFGGRLDGSAEFLNGLSVTREYTFDVKGRGRLRVTLDLSNRDDCVALQLFDPSGSQVNPASYDYPYVCPASGDSGQVFDIELSVAKPAPGRWRAVVNGIDVIDLSLRLRITLDDPSKTKATHLYPDLVPWLPWEFGFAAPASDHPGTAHDRDNQPGDPAVSCHPDEEPGDTRCLRFSAGLYNVGNGPMYISFRDDIAYQHIYRQDSTPLDFSDNEARGRYLERTAGSGEWHTFHEHRHLADFVLYELLEVIGPSGTLSPVGTGDKHGYCTFSQQIADWGTTKQDPQYSSYPSGVFCDAAMTLERGWGDIYRWQRPGQYVSYAAVADADGSMRAGRYVLRLTVDPEDNIGETNDSNNVGYTLIEVIDGGGLGQDTVIVCEQGLGTGPSDPARQVVPDRFAWAKLAADPTYVAPTCD